MPISGPYTATWNALTLGTQGDDGYELQCTIQGQEISESDAYGMTLVEAIYRGFNWRLRLRGLEWNKAGLLTLLQMFGTTTSTTPPIPSAANLIPALANVGDRWTKYCQAMVLTAILGNPPSIPQSLTATNAGFAPNAASNFNFTSKMREFPMELVLIPYSTTVGSLTVNVPFTTT